MCEANKTQEYGQWMEFQLKKKKPWAVGGAKREAIRTKDSKTMWIGMPFQVHFPTHVPGVSYEAELWSGCGHELLDVFLLLTFGMCAFTTCHCRCKYIICFIIFIGNHS